MRRLYFRFVGNSRGISLVELIVALGVMSLVSVGVGTGIYGLLSKQKSITHRLDANEFVSTLARALNEKRTCQEYLESKPAPLNWAPLQVANYSGYGSRPGETLGAGYVLNGGTGNPQLQVVSMDWRVKPNVSAQAYEGRDASGNLASLAKTVMQVRIGLRVNDQGRVIDIPTREIEMPVVVRADNLRVQACEGAPLIEDACANIVGASYNDKTGKCEIEEEGCQMRGSYVISYCDRSPCRASQGSPSRGNEYTKTHSCPANSKPMTSFNHTWTSREQTGKKSFVNVTNTVRAYVCMECKGKPAY